MKTNLLYKNSNTKWFGYKNKNKKDKKNKKHKDEVKILAKSKLSVATLDLCRYTPKIEPMFDEIFDKYQACQGNQSISKKLSLNR